MKKLISIFLVLCLLWTFAAAEGNEESDPGGENAYAAGQEAYSSGDYEKAAECYLSAAEKGNPQAQKDLAYLYYFGDGVEQSYEKAAEYFRMAVEYGLTDAYLALGYMYRHGEGVEQSFEKALELFQQAADAGEPEGLNNIGDMYETGDGVEQDFEKAIEYYQLSMEKGCDFALISMGMMYEAGHGVEQSDAKALECYLAADEKGVLEAKEFLDAMIAAGKITEDYRLVQQEGLLSEEEFRELNERLWKANSFDSVISRHDSYVIRWNYVYNSVYASVYQTKDARYKEQDNGYMEYIRSDHFGCLSSPDPNTGRGTPVLFADVAPDLSIHMQASTDTLEEFYDYEHDTLTGIDTIDNRIHIYTRYDEELSRSYLADWFGVEEPGMIVTTETIADAETLEEYEFIYRGERDGETVVLADVTMEYDVPEPPACRILRSFLDADSPNMRTGRIVVQPGTEEETTYEISVPVNTPVIIYASPDHDYAAFMDPEGTQIFQGDRLSDFNCYIFLHPDDEMRQLYEEQYAQLQNEKEE